MKRFRILSIAGLAADAGNRGRHSSPQRREAGRRRPTLPLRPRKYKFPSSNTR